MATKWEKFIEDAKLDPARYYRSPSDVVRDRRLSDAERLEILDAWERDARSLSVADDENMAGGEASHLAQVVKARIEVEQSLGRSPRERDKGADKAH